MAVTCRTTVTRALRKLGVLRSSGEPTAADAASGLASLQSFYMECISGGAFGRVFNVPISAAGTVTAGGNQHINILTADEVDVDLPATVPMYHWDTWRPCRDYGWGLNVPLGNDTGENVPRDKSVVSVTTQYGETRATYVYDSPIQRWLRIDSLDLNDEAPLSARSPDGLAALLAVRMADEFGDSTLSPLTLQAANKYKRDLVTNFGVGGYCDSYY